MRVLLKLRNAGSDGEDATIGQAENTTPEQEQYHDEQFLPAFKDDTAEVTLQRLQRYAGLYDGKYLRALKELERIQAARRPKKQRGP